MTTMEFEELQRIWDMQNNKPLYAFDEKALYNRILSKKKQAHHITNTTEWLVIIANVVSGLFILGVNLTESGNIFMYLLAVWMFGTALYVIVSRIQRIKGDHRFDRSLRGDLSHAVAVATYQVRLSMIMRWNILPVGILIVLGVWGTGKPLWLAAGILIFFAIAYYASGWEHNFYKRRKREFEILQDKLDNETPIGDPSQI